MISVVMPTYNREKTIGMAVNSILEQTYQDFEIIIVDDCSDDKTLEVIKKFDDSRIRCIQMERNMGACAARNRGVEEARGDIIAFQDSDDEWLPDKLERQVAQLEYEQADFSAGRMRRYYLDSKTRYKIYPSKKMKSEKCTYKAVLYKNCVTTPNLMVRRTCFEKVKFDPDIKKYQDWDFVLMMLKAGFKMTFLNEIVLNSYIGSNSITSRQNEYDAFVAIYKKYKADIDADKRIHARFLERMGNAKRIEGKDEHAYKLYLQSFKMHPTWKTFLKCSYFGLKGGKNKWKKDRISG